MFRVRMFRRSKRFAGAVGPGHHLGMKEALVETALDGNRLAFRHRLSTFAARSYIHQRAAAVVLNDELVDEYLGNLPFYRDGITVFHLRDRRRLQQHLRLTALEWRVLACLTLRHDVVVERSELNEKVYEGDADVDSNSLEVIVARLRRKIGHEMIETVRGRGYRLISGTP
jgi:hypothetical protein